MKKKKFLKEKIIYTSLTIVIICMAVMSVSSAFPNNSSYDEIPVINFNNTGIYYINGEYNDTKKIDVIMTSDTRKSTCSYNINFKFTGESKYIKSDENIIKVTGYDNKKVIFDTELSSVNKNNNFTIADYSISGNKTVTQNLSFNITYNGNAYYEGYVYIDNVICK